MEINPLRHGSSISVQDASQVGEARRLASAFAHRLGFDEEAAGRVAIAVSEAARNVSLHGGGGEIVLTALPWHDQSCVEVLALDRGPGMPDIAKCMRDGYSTSGTTGTGLGAIARLADHFDIHSIPGAGTALMARFCPRRSPSHRDGARMEFSAACLAHSGEDLCGDAWAQDFFPGGATFAMADGLGHGEYASQAAQEALRIFRQSSGDSPTAILERMHAAMRSTRGAAVALARLDFQRRSVTFAGIGNISAAILSDTGSRSMVSLNGTVGHEIRKIQEFQYPWPQQALLIMHTDGLGSRWNLDSYAGLATRSPGLIAGVLYRDFSRRRDDVTVLVAREC